MKKSLLLLTGLLALSATAMAADATVEAPTTTAAPAQFKPTGYVAQYLRFYGDKYKDVVREKDSDQEHLYLRTYASAQITKNISIYARQDDTFKTKRHEGSKYLYQRTDLMHSWGTLGDSAITLDDDLRLTSYESSKNADADDNSAYNSYYLRETLGFADLFPSTDSFSVDYFNFTPAVIYSDDKNADTRYTHLDLDLDTGYSLFKGIIPGSLSQELEAEYTRDVNDISAENQLLLLSDTYYSLTYGKVGNVTFTGSDELEFDNYKTLDQDKDWTMDVTNTFTPFKATYQVNTATSMYVAAKLSTTGSDSPTSDAFPTKYVTQPELEIGWHVSF